MSTPLRLATRPAPRQSDPHRDTIDAMSATSLANRNTKGLRSNATPQPRSTQRIAPRSSAAVAAPSAPPTPAEPGAPAAVAAPSAPPTPAEPPPIAAMTVGPRGRGWALTVDDLPEPAWVVGTRKAAVAAARDAARFHRAELRVLTRTGKVSKIYDHRAPSA
jgi:hypothetical protein